MKKLFLCCLIVILLCLASCEQNVLETGSLTVSMNESGVKNITPDKSEINIVQYEVSGTLSADSTKTFSKKDLTTKTVTVEDLVVGTWNIVAKGYNSNGNLIAESASTEATISQDQATEVTLALNYLTDGTGSLSYSIRWSENIDKIQKFLIEIEGMDPVTLLKEKATLTDNSYELTGTLNDLASGQHDLLIKALDSNGNQVGMSIDEKIDIFKGLTSVYVETLDEGLYPPNTPAFSVVPGEVPFNTEVAISTQTDGADIIYTTDGSDPDDQNNGFQYTTPINIYRNMTIKAIAVLNGRFSSKVASGTYTLPARITITVPLTVYDLQILKTDVPRDEKEVLYLQSPSYKGTADVSWKINGVEKTDTATLSIGSNLVMAKTTVGGKEYIENKVITADSLEDVKLSNQLNVSSKTAMEMVTVFSEETTITGTTKMSGSQVDRFGVLIEGLKVTLSPYEIGKYEVTQELFNQVMGFNPSVFQGADKLPAEGDTQGLRPVENVRWYDAVAFCNKLTDLTMDSTECVYNITGIKRVDDDDPNSSITSATVSQDLTKKGYRLPTEAEWECAARGGNPTDTTNWNYEYSGSDNLEDVAWYNPISNSMITHEVGKKYFNSLGLNDMTGNVKEWCWDKYGGYYYTSLIDSSPDIEVLNNPTGPDNEMSNRIVRGGGWGSVQDEYKVFYRNISDPNGSHLPGFRLCRTL